MVTVAAMTGEHPIRQFREQQDPPLSQLELARLIGVSKPTVSRWESGERVPERRYLAKLVEVTGISVEALLGLGTREPAA